MGTDWKAYHRDYWHKRRQKIIDYLGGICVKCGSTENLEFDHIDPSQKKISINSRCSIENIKDELAKCQLLCRRCHGEKTIAERAPFTHGTMYAWQKMHCKCDPCNLKRREWYDKRNERRRIPR